MKKLEISSHSLLAHVQIFIKSYKHGGVREWDELLSLLIIKTKNFRENLLCSIVFNFTAFSSWLMMCRDSESLHSKDTTDPLRHHICFWNSLHRALTEIFCSLWNVQLQKIGFSTIHLPRYLLTSTVLHLRISSNLWLGENESYNLLNRNVIMFYWTRNTIIRFREMQAHLCILYKVSITSSVEINHIYVSKIHI